MNVNRRWRPPDLRLLKYVQKSNRRKCCLGLSCKNGAKLQATKPGKQIFLSRFSRQNKIKSRFSRQKIEHGQFCLENRDKFFKKSRKSRLAPARVSICETFPLSGVEVFSEPITYLKIRKNAGRKKNYLEGNIKIPYICCCFPLS